MRKLVIFGGKSCSVAAGAGVVLRGVAAGAGVSVRDEVVVVVERVDLNEERLVYGIVWWLRRVSL